MQSTAFEQYIQTLLNAAAVETTSSPADRARVDFTFVDRAGKHIAVEAKGYHFVPDKTSLDSLVTAVESLVARVNKFLLVTPMEPSARDRENFASAFCSKDIVVEWLSGDQLADHLGLGDLAGFAVRRYRSHNERVVTHSDLDRQLSRRVVSELNKSSKPPESFLKIGERVPVVVVLSDLKSFSLLVKAANPDHLNDAMSKYYRLARDLVWSHDGVLDKFIGDAVLAIFGYPVPDAKAHVSAARFAADLIEIGKPILEGIKDAINEVVETGTRVGISGGDISVLNIGLDRIELSFVGDVINLAARLENQCEVDGCLIDNLTKVAISKADHNFYKALSLKNRKLNKGQVKGQLASIQAWQIPPTAIPGIANVSRVLPAV